jgi:hypothetical protein
MYLKGNWLRVGVGYGFTAVTYGLVNHLFGNSSTLRVSLGLDCEISQFWQFRHAKLQPAVAMENDLVPGR